MISLGAEKMVSISQYKPHEDSKEVFIFFGGLDTIYNPISVTKHRSQTMNELKAHLEKLLGVKIDLTNEN